MASCLPAPAGAAELRSPDLSTLGLSSAGTGRSETRVTADAASGVADSGARDEGGDGATGRGGAVPGELLKGNRRWETNVDLRRAPLIALLEQLPADPSIRLMRYRLARQRDSAVAYCLDIIRYHKTTKAVQTVRSSCVTPLLERADKLSIVSTRLLVIRLSPVFPCLTWHLLLRKASLLSRAGAKSKDVLSMAICRQYVVVKLYEQTKRSTSSSNILTGLVYWGTSNQHSSTSTVSPHCKASAKSTEVVVGWIHLCLHFVICIELLDQLVSPHLPDAV